MEKLVGRTVYITVICLCILLPFACVKDQATYTYTVSRPVFQSLSMVRANMHSGPAQPILNPGKMYLKDNFVFLNEKNQGIHVIDISDPGRPVNRGFIPIPGNQDMAVKGNTLFVGSFSDLVAMDISDPLHVTPQEFLDNVFPDLYSYTGSRTNPDSTFVIMGWIAQDTTVPYKNWISGWVSTPAVMAAASNAAAVGSADNGTGGSMSRFTVVNEYLYAVTNSRLNIIDVHMQSRPSVAGDIPVASGAAETVYPFTDKLFVGSTAGMYVYDISSNPAIPVQIGAFVHARACDPVIADGTFAYITLNDGNICSGYTNELQVVNISNLSNATLVQTYPMTHPEGLAKDGNMLFVCDGSAGLRVLDATDASHIQQTAEIHSLTPYEVILSNKMAIVAASEGLFLYDYHDPSHITQIGRL